MANSFPKHSRLCGQERIAHLYKEGKRFTAWPLRVTYMPTKSDTQVLVWAPKSLFKRAVKRNHLRRLMREAYRLHQDLLDNHQSPITNHHYLIAFNYMDKEEQPYALIEKAVIKALKKIRQE
ncbi:MAG: ribonuclease P protein component [Paludibacteraceae bacterium]|nr:ribonuclease P protein component [Paludibacteraceae bacterium]